MFVYNALTSLFYDSTLLVKKKCVKLDNLSRPSNRAMQEVRPLQRNTVNFYEVCGLYRGFRESGAERKIWRTVPF